ncbi:hypothetical protein CFP56_022802 [Quercus suber]|uniref:Uncharacterized protein n=1 Tax=Quercus suber TaxID=58331 RepID=A0AAW0KCL4_QUESU
MSRHAPQAILSRHVAVFGEGHSIVVFEQGDLGRMRNPNRVGGGPTPSDSAPTSHESPCMGFQDSLHLSSI